MPSGRLSPDGRPYYALIHCLVIKRWIARQTSVQVGSRIVRPSKFNEKKYRPESFRASRSEQLGQIDQVQKAWAITSPLPLLPAGIER
jgi:hypothetical protein